MKAEMFIQAVSYFDNPHKVELNNIEMKSNAACTYITLDVIDVDFECEELTEENFQEMRAAQVEKIKAKIMQDAQDQCDKLGVT